MEKTNKHKVEVNGQEYIFNVQKDLTEPCPQCGIPACGKENYFWIEDGGQRQTLVLDGSLLDVIIEQYFNVNILKVEYETLPKFLREFNEHKGWSEADDFNGSEIDVDDLLEAINIIKVDDLEEWMKESGKTYLSELKKMANAAIEKEIELYVARS
jgi:hypothetical protein